MLPYLPTCEPGPQPSALAAHPGWAQAASADSSAFGARSPHPPASQPAGATSFSFPPSAPGPGGGGAGSRDGGTYQGALLARDQYPSPLGRPAAAPYPAAYPAYVSAEVAPPWASGPLGGSLLHSLPSRPAGFAGHRATLGECGLGRLHRAARVPGRNLLRGWQSCPGRAAPATASPPPPEVGDPGLDSSPAPEDQGSVPDCAGSEPTCRPLLTKGLGSDFTKFKSPVSWRKLPPLFLSQNVYTFYRETCLQMPPCCKFG